MQTHDLTHEALRPQRGGGAALLTLCGIALAAALSGCASSPPARTQVIIPSLPPLVATTASAPGGANAAPASAVTGVVLGIVGVPEYWQQRTVRYQGHDAVLAAWPNAVWAERVEVGMTRRLSQALRAQVPALGWWQADDLRAPLRLLVDVEQLDIDPQAGVLRSRVTWRLLDRQAQVKGRDTVNSQQPVAVHNASEQAEVMGQWLDGLAAQIAPQVQRAQQASAGGG